MNNEIKSIFNNKKLIPVLIDIGASGERPKIWEDIAPYSIYIGFDPDKRDLHDSMDKKYYRSIVVNEAVTNLSNQEKIDLYLTISPHCSSTLLPDNDSLNNYLFSNLFIVEKEVLVSASTLSKVLNRYNINQVDWFKTDSQGIDLRLFQSMDDAIRNKVLAVDVEPGLIDAYQGEDLFVNTHQELVHQGFWLSSIDVKGSVRIKRETIKELKKYGVHFNDLSIYNAIKYSPGWCESRYLRSVESLIERDASERDYLLLWVFSILEKQWGYALDIACYYKNIFSDENISKILRDVPINQIKKSNRNISYIIKSLIPENYRKMIRKLLRK